MIKKIKEMDLRQRFGICGGLLFIIMFLTNLVIILSKRGSYEGNYDQFILLGTGLLLLLTAKLKFGHIIQILLTLVSTFWTIFSEPADAYGIILLFLNLLLIYEYGFYKKEFVLKVIITVILVLAIFIIAAANQQISLVNMIPRLLFTVMFFLFYNIIRYKKS